MPGISGRLYKTRMCRNFKIRGECNYKEKCQFAHGEAEIRKIEYDKSEDFDSLPEVPQYSKSPLNYKTVLCSFFIEGIFINRQTVQIQRKVLFRARRVRN